MILPSPTAPLGSVAHLRDWSPATFVPSDAILCRVTAPLIRTAFQLLRANVVCYVLGKDIAAGLTTQIKKFRATSRDDLIAKITQWRDREVETLESRKRFSAASTISDRAECLLIFATKAHDGPESAIALITKLFADGHGVTLATVHKAKGLEWNRVFILDRAKYMPSKFATQGWQKEQEMNIIYVAITRAQVDLCYIESKES